MQIINGTYLANFVFSIGYFSEVWMVLLVVVVFTVIYRSALHLFFFIVFFLVNIFLNSALKQYVQQERPSGSLKLFASDETFISGRKKQVYGMPSGHSQKVFFSIAYLLLVLSYSSGVVAIHHHPMFLGLLFTIAALMFVQRLVYRNHTPAQLLVGAAVGITTAYIAYYVVEYASRIT